MPRHLNEIYVHQFGFCMEGCLLFNVYDDRITTGLTVTVLYMHPMITLYVSPSVKTNDALLSRLATVPFSRLFSCEGNLEYSGCDSTEHRGTCNLHVVIEIVNGKPCQKNSGCMHGGQQNVFAGQLDFCYNIY
jgi:hypothetical protein